MRSSQRVASVGILCVVLAAGAVSLRAAPAGQAPMPPAAPSVPPRAVLDKYCVTCHNARAKTAGLLLDQLDVEHVATSAETWEKVVRKLRGGTMPPAGMPRPDKATFAGLIGSLETALDRAGTANDNPGRPLIHRLNRVEYANAIRDLLDLEIDGPALLPPDTSGFGFDNVADVLSMSPGLVERYMAAARRISRAAIGDPAIRTDVKRYNISRLLLQADREDDGQSFGTRGGTVVHHHFPLDGEYLLRIEFQLSYYQRRTDVRGRNEDNQIDVRIDGQRVKTFALERSSAGRGAAGAPSIADEGQAPLELRLPVTAGTHEVSVALVKKIAAATEGPGPSRLPQSTTSFWWFNVPTVETGKFEMSLAFLEVQGPFNGAAPRDTPSRRRLLVCRPPGGGDQLSCARTVIGSFARRAFRRPVAPDEMEMLLAFYRKGSAEGGFDQGIQSALERALVAPQFLFRMEDDPPAGTTRRVSDLELASRLSFFLWSSIPDDQLLDVATRGQLRSPGVLERQVRRMLADRKSEAWLSNFFGQWLWLRNMDTVKPNTDVFPAFDDTLRTALARETELFIESQVRDDHSVVDLLTADYTFVNERVARHYGIPNIYGPDFRRITLTDGMRAGLLGQGSVLTVTAYPNRTSPVVRAKWLLENILGTPPPEPPPNVPQLKDDEKGQVPSSMRAKMEQHRKNPVCASCHSMLDPLGFSLENFDAVGQYRASEGDGVTRIDASGSLPDGRKFDGPAAFRTALLDQRETFVTTVTRKLLTYALGRGAEYYDMPAVRRIVRDAAGSNDRWSSIVLGIIRSAPFQMRRSES